MVPSKAAAPARGCRRSECPGGWWGSSRHSSGEGRRGASWRAPDAPFATGKHAHLLVDVISFEEEGAEQRSDLGSGSIPGAAWSSSAKTLLRRLSPRAGAGRNTRARRARRSRSYPHHGRLAGDHLEQRRFARAVGADERYLVATPDVEVEVLVDPLRQMTSRPLRRARRYHPCARAGERRNAVSSSPRESRCARFARAS